MPENRLPPRHNAMHLLGPSLLLLEYLAFSHSWKLEHPDTLYAWEGACVWIPCSYRIPGDKRSLDNLTVYQNYLYDDNIKEFNGSILYRETKINKFLLQKRVTFLGDNKFNCTISIDPVRAQDSGQLGLRMMSGADKWMEHLRLNVSKTAPPPHIQLPLNIQETQQVTVTCLLNFSCPGYEIRLKWFLEGLPSTELASVTSTSLTTETVYTLNELTFQALWNYHGKNLTCQLWNDRAQGLLSQETVRLDVQHKPKLKIEVSPRGANVTKGDSVTMTCQITSSNPEYSTISWLKNGIPLQEPEMLRMEQRTLTLTLATVTKEMSGNYCCEAHNNIGIGQSQIVAVQVRYAPEPSRVQISPLLPKEGNKVVLTCMSPANPLPTNYTWYRNNIVLLGRTDVAFQIPKVSLMHAGSYSCLAENSLGRGSSGQEAKLDVQYSPKGVTTVIQNPTPIREGDTVTLFCNYTSSNPNVTRYEWSPPGSGSEPVPGVLRIPKVAWNAKPIACTACNEWCSPADPVHLHVQHAPKGVKILPTSSQSEIHAGHRVILQCNFSSSCPTDVRFFWKKNGIHLQEGRELSFDSISPEDAGNYNCMVNNSIGQSTSEGWRLRVLYAPRRLQVSISPKNSVMEGTEVVLTCEGDGNPPAYQYTWFDWNNQDLYHYDQRLRLDPVKVQHSGAYWCQGTNRLGVGQSPHSTLTVYYSPKTISKRVAMGVGLCLAVLLLAFFAVKLQQSWKRIRSQQEPQENSSGQSFFVRKKKVRRGPCSEAPNSLGCYNPVMEDAVSYATLRFPVGKTDAPSSGPVPGTAVYPFPRFKSITPYPPLPDAGTSEAQRPSLSRDNTVTYSVVQKHPAGDYENVTPDAPEDEGIHYSELVHLGIGERPLVQDTVEYVTLKH